MPSPYSDDLVDIGSQAIEQLTLRNRAREQALSASREVIRHSANAIRAVHRGEFEEARQVISQAALRLSRNCADPPGKPGDLFRGLSGRRPQGVQRG